MEQYFDVERIPPKEQVTLITMFLSKDANLWWHTRLNDDVESGRPRINTSETLRRELKDQFLPKTMDWMALESLKRLKHTETIRDYAKEFTSLILNMKDMSKVDKLFKFISRLQGWTQTKLRRCLIDYQLDASSSTSQKGKGLQQQ